MSTVDKYLNERRGMPLDYHKKCGDELRNMKNAMKEISKRYKKLKKEDLSDDQWKRIYDSFSDADDSLNDANYFYGK